MPRLPREKQVRREHMTDQEYARLSALFDFIRRMNARRAAQARPTRETEQ